MTLPISTAAHKMATLKAPVNHIIDSSFIDGPGNRTVIFFQGCNFNCKYCHNPETINLCIHCGQCIAGCPAGALEMIRGKVVWDDRKCVDCGACYKNCAYSATPRVKESTVEAVMAHVMGNRPFIRGITVSGGECSLQRDFLVELFSQAKAAGLSTLMDSNGGLPIAWDDELMAVTDGVMLDIKETNLQVHLELAGHSNEMVLKNAVELAKRKKLTEIRTVVLADNPYSRQTVIDTGELLAPYLKDTEVIYRLIKFRPIGVRGEAERWPMPSQEQMETLKALVASKGFARVIIT